MFTRLGNNPENANWFLSGHLAGFRISISPSCHICQWGHWGGQPRGCKDPHAQGPEDKDLSPLQFMRQFMMSKFIIYDAIYDE